MNLITDLLIMINQIKVMHWQTSSFAAHKAFDEAHSDLSSLVDQFVEVYQGKKGKIIKSDAGFKIFVSNITDNPSKLLEEYISMLHGPLAENLSKEKDSDLLNIRDEMVSVLNKTKYLLTLS